MVSNAVQRKCTYYEPLLNKTACDFDKELKPMVFKHLKDR